MHIDFGSNSRKRHLAKGTLMALAGGLSIACSAHDGGSGEELPGSPADNGSVSSAPATAQPSTVAAAAPVAEKPAREYAIDLGGQHKVKYALFEDGAMLVSDSGKLGTDKPIAEAVSMLTPADAFRSLRPGEAVPQDLMDAEPLFAPQLASELDEQRDAELAAAATKPALPVRSYAPAVTGLIPKAGNSDPSIFLSIFGCFHSDDGSDWWAPCLTNAVDWANAPAQSRWAIYKVLPYLGSIVVQIKLAGVVRWTVTVPQDNFHFIRARGAMKTHTTRINGNRVKKNYPDIVDHQFQIIQSTGSQFHLGLRFHNYAAQGPNCAEIWPHDLSQWLSFDAQIADCPSNHYNTSQFVLAPQ